MSADGSNNSDFDGSDDSLEEFKEPVEAGSVSEDSDFEHDDDEEAIQVLDDEDVELDAAAGKAQSVKSELAALRRQARETSTKSAWNKRERHNAQVMLNSSWPILALFAQLPRVIHDVR